MTGVSASPASSTSKPASPTEAIASASGAACPSTASRSTWQAQAHKASASCSAQPGAGCRVGVGADASRSRAPFSSNRPALTLVVPRSSASSTAQVHQKPDRGMAGPGPVHVAGMDHPRFRDLPVDPAAPPRSSWGLWGRDDEVGTINLLTPERVERAARLVRRGAVFPLCWKLELPAPALFGRSISCRHVLDQAPVGTDDYFEPFLAARLDPLGRAVRVGASSTASQRPEPGRVLGAGADGIDHWARRGVAGRFVLADVAGTWPRPGRASS